MARNRQRAKERQAERRAAREAAGGETRPPRPDAEPPPVAAGADPLFPQAPPQELGHSDYTLEHTSESEEFIGDLQVGDEAYDGEDYEDGIESTTVAGPRGVRGGRETEE